MLNAGFAVTFLGVVDDDDDDEVAFGVDVDDVVASLSELTLRRLCVDATLDDVVTAMLVVDVVVSAMLVVDVVASASDRPFVR